MLISLLSMGQKPVVYLEVDTKEAEVGEVLTITVKSNVQGEIDIDFPADFVHGYNIMNGMEQEIDYNTGKVVTYYYLSQTGAISKSGTYKIGPAYIKKGNKVYKSNAVNITVRKENVSNSNGDGLTAKQLRQPAFGIIEKSKSVLYEGEPLILNAKVYSQFNASHLEDYQAYSLDGVVDKHEIGNTTRIVVEEEKIKRNTYYTFIYDKKVVFPIGTGKMEIDPFKLILRRGMDGLPITSSGTTIEVRPLPDNIPNDFIGGVGQFSVSRKIQSGTFKQGDVFTMSVEITGFGNLQNIIEPKLNLPKGFVVYGDPIVKEDFVYGSRGAEGKISYEYNIQITKFGKLTLPETTISYFDPTKEKYIQERTGSEILSIEKNEKFKSISDDPTTLVQTESSEILFPLRRDSGNLNTDDLIYSSKGFWIAIGSPLFLAFVLGLWWKKKEEENSVSEQKIAKKQSHIEIQYLFNEAENALKNGEFANYYGCIEKGVLRSMALFLKQDDTLVLGKAEIFAELTERNIPQPTIEALRSIFSTCEQARYGMGLTNEERDNLIISAKQIIQSISKS
jgi:hypothetical protein